MLRSSDGPPLHPPRPSADSGRVAQPQGIPATPALPAGDHSTLARSVRLRFPNLKEMNRGERGGAIEDHITATARMKGELAELRLAAHATILTTDEEWRDIQVGKGTKAEVDAAKARARPELARQRKVANWVVERCTEEMERLDADYASASRAYTVMMGA